MCTTKKSTPPHLELKLCTSSFRDHLLTKLFINVASLKILQVDLFPGLKVKSSDKTEPPRSSIIVRLFKISFSKLTGLSALITQTSYVAMVTSLSCTFFMKQNVARFVFCLNKHKRYCILKVNFVIS